MKFQPPIAASVAAAATLCFSHLLPTAEGGSIKPKKNNNNEYDDPKSNGRGGRMAPIDMASIARGKLKEESSMTVIPMKGRKGRIFNKHGASKNEKHKNDNDIDIMDDIFFGESEEDESTINLIACGSSDNPRVCGSMNDVTLGLTYEFKYDREGDAIVVETPVSTYPPEGDPVEFEDDAEAQQLFFDRDRNLRGQGVSKLDIHIQNERSYRSLQGQDPIMDVMVLYTPAAECKAANLARGCTRNASTRQDMLDDISVAIAVTNNAYIASDIQARIRLVHTACVEGYDEADKGSYSDAYNAALYRMRYDNDGYVDEIHDNSTSGFPGLRSMYKADMVSLIIDDGYYCGIGFRPNTPSVYSMYSVTGIDCLVGGYTFAHELGHNQGCRHDRGTSGYCNENDPWGAYGYRHPEGRWATIVAYRCAQGQCDNNPTQGCSRIQRFSNPRQTYSSCILDPMGIAEGVPGSIGEADNAKHINEVAPAIENLYDACVVDADCEDLNPCTMNVCSNGVCKYNEISCDDSDGCTVDACDLETGTCYYEPLICANATNVCNATLGVNGACPAGPVSCMSGQTGVLRQQGAKGKAVVKTVEKLRIGDEILGLDENKEETTCIVEAIGHFGIGPTYGNYTEDHFVLDTSDYSVFAHGQVGEEEVVDKYAVLTSCPVGLDESGTGFTPVDSDFVGERLSWADYVIIHKAMLDMVRETGTSIWFSPEAYTSMDTVKNFLTEFYQGILTCAADADNCDPLEIAISNLVENSLTADAKKKAKKAFPQLGWSKEAGSVAALVSKGKSVR